MGRPGSEFDEGDSRSALLAPSRLDDPNGIRVFKIYKVGRHLLELLKRLLLLYATNVMEMEPSPRYSADNHPKVPSEL